MYKVNHELIVACVVILVILFVFSTVITFMSQGDHTQKVSATAETEETAYLRFVSSQVNESNIGNINNSTGTPVPEIAKGPAIPPKGYLVEEIRDGLYWVTDGAYNTMFLVTDNGVVAVDAPPSLGVKYLQAIAEVTDKPVKYLIYSHAHIDHIGAAGLFPKNITIIAQDETAHELQNAKSVARNITMVPPVPTVTFSKNYSLEIGNQTLKLDYYGINHLPGNIFIYAPKQEVLMLVDVIFPGWVPFAYLAVAKDVGGFIKAHDIVLNNYEFDTIVAGHLTRLGTRDDVSIQREFVTDLQKAATTANDEIAFSKIAQQIGGFENPWLIFTKYIDAVNEKCLQLMLPKWEGKLGGVAEFMPTHCFSMTEAGRIDPTVQALLQNSTFAYK